ncbi:FecR family protein [Pedobacter soli]|uniref:FecR family protein n=1 Tax=Pedobacter soli TaxID=390242 RepID=A0A1G6ZBA3_9SPHI|nr:FecR family protein [Pedobacter soli]SDD99036.1 FecR family protein [Pedobacter soli]
MVQKKDAKQLLKKYLEGNCTDGEKALVEAWYNQFEENERPLITAQDQELQLKEIQNTLPPHFKSPRVIPLWPIIAATIVIALLATLHFYTSYSKKIAGKLNNDARAAVKVQPAGNKATLTLPNGKVIVLNDVKSGEIAQATGFKIMKSKDGKLSYVVDELGGNKEIGSNTIATPRGGQYQINLPDGSKVWLNACSNLRFSVGSSPFKREVELTGEAYFEIAKKTDKLGNRLPFLVKTSTQTVEVLGTHFNISAYRDEQKTTTTLLEGSVKINLPTGSKLLKPGQQATVQNNHINTQEADIEYVMAWKNGMFIFDDEPIEEIMKKISNWYDVDVVYLDADKKQLFGGSISRYAEIGKVLEKLELTNGVHFKIEGRRVIVMK